MKYCGVTSQLDINQRGQPLFIVLFAYHLAIISLNLVFKSYLTFILRLISFSYLHV